MEIWSPRLLVTSEITPWRDWLTTGGSLSERIRQRCGTDFRVQPVFQGRAPARPDELARLNLPPGARPLVREVILFDGNTPLVFARSLASIDDLNGPWRGLRGLGSRPLATMLFADPGIRRGDLEFRQLSKRSALHARARKSVTLLPTQLWARRSIFFRCGAPLMVTEAFLPGILELEPPRG